MRRRRQIRIVAAAALFLAVTAGVAAVVAVGAFQPTPKAVPIAARPKAPVPPAPAALQTRLDDLAHGYGEPVGISVTDVASGWTASVDGDTPYPQQSVSKLWVAVTLLDGVDHGKFNLDQSVTLGPGDRSVFFQPVAELIPKDGMQITLRNLLQRAISESDNAANDRLMREVGGPKVVAATLAAKGVTGIAGGEYERDLQAKTAGLTWKPEYGFGWNFKGARALLPPGVRDAALAAYLAAPPDGATPAGMTQALAALKRGELLSPSSTTTLLDIMAQARTGPMRLKGGLPQGWTIAHKTGTGPDWRGGSTGIDDVGLITAPDGHSYAVAVMMRHTRKPVPARLAFMQSVTRAVVAEWMVEGGGA